MQDGSSAPVTGSTCTTPQPDRKGKQRESARVDRVDRLIENQRLDSPSLSHLRWPPVAVIRIDPDRVVYPSEGDSPDRPLTDQVAALLAPVSARGKRLFSQVATPSRHAEELRPFRCVGYRRIFSVQRDFAAQFFSADAETNPKTSEQEEYLFFFSRMEMENEDSTRAPLTELYAIATRLETEKRLRGFADLAFTHRIANHFCFPSYSRVVKRPMAGSVIYEEVVKQEGHLDDLDFSLVTEVTCPVRLDEIPIQRKQEAERLLHGCTITLWPDAVRLNRWLSPKNLAFVLDLYATTDPRRVLPPDPSLYIGCWAGSERKEETSGLSTQSTQRLVDMLYEAFHQGYPYTTDLRVVPPVTRPTNWETAKWYIEHNGRFCPWKWRLNASEVLRFLWEVLPDLQRLDREGFGEALRAITLHHDTTEQNLASPLLDCFEGCVTMGAHHLYRMNARWCSPRAPSLASQFRRFQQILQENLIDQDHEAYLYLGWRQGVDEGLYNQDYQKEPNFLVGDKACPRGLGGAGGIELWDLVKVIPGGKLYVYAVKDGLDKHTRVVADQTYQSALTIAEMYEDPNSDLFLELEEKMNKKSRKALAKYGGAAELQKEFQKRKRSEIVFVVAVRPGYDLRRESHTSCWYPPTLPPKFLVSLQNQGLVDRQQRLTDRLVRLLAYKLYKSFSKEIIYRQWSATQKKKLYHVLKQLETEKSLDVSSAEKALTLFDFPNLARICLARSPVQPDELRKACVKYELSTAQGTPTTTLKTLDERSLTEHLRLVADDLGLPKKLAERLHQQLVALTKEDRFALVSRSAREMLCMELFSMDPEFWGKILQDRGLSDTKDRLTARCINLSKTSPTNFWGQGSSVSQLSYAAQEGSFKTIQALLKEKRQDLNCLKWFDETTLEKVSKTVGVGVAELKRALQSDLQPALVDEEERITGRCIDFLGESEENFIKQFDPEVGDPKEKKQMLMRLREHAGTHLGSTVAVLSIVELAEKIKRLGFDFKICSIEKEDSTSKLTSVHYKGSVDKARFQKPIKISGKSYVISETRDEGLSPLHAVLGNEEGCWKQTLSSQQRRREFVKLIRGLGRSIVIRQIGRMLATDSLQKKRFLESACRQSHSIAASAYGLVDSHRLLRQEEQLFLDYFQNVTSKTQKVLFLLNALHGENLFPKRNVDSASELRKCRRVSAKEKGEKIIPLRKNPKKVAALFRKNRALVRTAILEGPQSGRVQNLFGVCQTLAFRPPSIGPEDLYYKILECPEYVYGHLELNLLSLSLRRKILVCSYDEKGALRVVPLTKNPSLKEPPQHVFYDLETTRYLRLKEALSRNLKER